MSSADLWEDGYPHGTVEGYDDGCRGGACPAADVGMPCKRAKTLAAGDFRYNRLAAAGKTPAEIAAAIDATDEPTGRTTRTPKTTQTSTPTTPAEVSIAGPPTTATGSEGPAQPVSAAASRAAATTAAEIAAAALTAATPTAPAPSTPTTKRTRTPAPITTDKFTAGLTQRGKRFVISNIREWARKNGYPGISGHGTIPTAALIAYDAAHPNHPTAVHPTAVHPTSVADHVPAGAQLATPAADGDFDDLMSRARQRADIPTPTPDRYQPTAERPDWSEVTVSEDVETARSFAIRLEAENALLLRHAAAAQQSIDAALRLNTQLQDDNATLRGQLLETELALSRAVLDIELSRGATRLAKARIDELENTTPTTGEAAQP